MSTKGQNGKAKCKVQISERKTNTSMKSMTNIKNSDESSSEILQYIFKLFWQKSKNRK